MSRSECAAQLYPQTPGSPFVAFYDYQGYGGGILTHLYMAISQNKIYVTQNTVRSECIATANTRPFPIFSVRKLRSLKLNIILISNYNPPLLSSPYLYLKAEDKATALFHEVLLVKESRLKARRRMRWVREYAAVTHIKALYLQYHRERRKLQKLLANHPRFEPGTFRTSL
jgi:hypothetical protein